MSKNEKSHLPSEVDDEYKKFVIELIKKEENGETVDYEKESLEFWNKKLKNAVKNQKTD